MELPQCNKLTIQMARSSSFARSFIPTTWDQLPKNLRRETNVKTFKKEINERTKYVFLMTVLFSENR